MKVLITDGEYPHTLGIIRSLGVKKIEVNVVSTKKRCISFYSKFSKKKIISPVSPYFEKGYIEFIKKVLKEEKYDVLIPVGFQTTKIISKNRNKLEKFVKLEVADYETINLAMDKSKTYELAKKLGISYPKTIYPQTFKEVENLSYYLDFPVVIKGLYEAGKQVISYPNNRDEFITDYHILCEENGFKEGSLPMVQEYIGKGGNECLAALYQNGKVKRFVVYKAIRCFPIKGGASSCATTFYDKEIVEKGTKLLNALNWHGVADVEFKRDKKNGKLKLMEINPKFYATVEVAIRAGMNFPYYLCQMAAGNDLEFSNYYERNLIYNYPFSKELIHLKENPSSIFHFIIDTVNQKVKSNIWLIDFKANIFELATTIASFLPKKTKQLLKYYLK